MSNSIFTIFPYFDRGTLLFDDEERGLKREALVQGIPEMVAKVCERLEINPREEEIRIQFCATPFPESQDKLVWLRGDKNGNWYRLESESLDGWLCPALFCYWETAPTEIYISISKVAPETESEPPQSVYRLVKFRDECEELLIEGYEIMSEEYFEHFAQSVIDGNYPIEVFYGPIESNEFEDPAELMNCLEVCELTSKEVELLERLEIQSMGFLPSDLLYSLIEDWEEWIDDESEDEEEE